MRRLARAARHAPDRLLHRIRHRRLVRRLARRGHPRSVLFVCHGNICRSPYAAAAFIRALPPWLRENVRVTSAGFIGADRPAPPPAQRVAARRGLDLSAHRSVLISPMGARAVDLVVVMDARQRAAVCDMFGGRWGDVVLLGDLDPEPIDTRAIRDPVEQPEDVFEAVYDRIDRCVRVLADTLAHRAPGAGAPA